MAPKDFSVQYSDDNLNWETLFSGTHLDGSHVLKNYHVNASSAHHYWRLYFTSSYHSDGWVVIGELTINADELISVTDYELDTTTGQCVVAE